ncbi:hypothetical protein BOX15_Mlig011055g1 [Macrostomum lignano]|uniref:Eukaryotic translation initiation factor 5A n=2 Tax=Macrostomum lignano TaxID=282301 RepID=A0A1I8HX51_9PLAT|nr:hypothetical protein BOX15_Mlig011055g1 [Macrostomum lignano]
MANNFDDDNEYHSADAGASLFVPTICSNLRKGGHVLIKDRPCKIVEMSTSKTGKHGSAKVHLVAIDIFTNKKYEDISPSSANMQVPNVARREYQLVNISDEGFLELMSENGDMKEDIRLPEGDIGSEIRRRFDADESLVIQVLASMKEEGVVAVRAMQDKSKP